MERPRNVRRNSSATRTDRTPHVLAWNRTGAAPPSHPGVFQGYNLIVWKCFPDTKRARSSSSSPCVLVVAHWLVGTIVRHAGRNGNMFIGALELQALMPPGYSHAIVTQTLSHTHCIPMKVSAMRTYQQSCVALNGNATQGSQHNRVWLVCRESNFTQI